ncbi:MAG: sterol desaturase family protein [Planctomycetes bacterium]|nr:sterol desaturase family protein [Planctomycetota bacterium]
MADLNPSFLSECITIIYQSYGDSTTWFWNMLSHPFSEHNYLFLLIIISLAVYGIELLFPWRKIQKRIRKDFWLDSFYMFFNFFFFTMLIYAALSSVCEHSLQTVLSYTGSDPITNSALSIQSMLSPWTHLLILFIVRDFIQWCIHRCLHSFNFLWQFHKVHHSVQEMGFAAHLRYHWMENIVYNIIQYIPLALLGFSVVDFFTVTAITVCIGHLNHANIRLPLGPLKYIFNNPQMHIWHHAQETIAHHPQGKNFGLSLSCWDYIFGTAYIPYDGRDMLLGFEDMEDYPSGFIKQSLSGFSNKK